MFLRFIQNPIDFWLVIMTAKIILCLILLVASSLGCYLEHVRIRGKSMQSLNQIFMKYRFDYDNTYHNWTTIERQLKVVSTEQPNATDLISLGKTAEDRDIWAVIVANGSESRDKRLVVFECGIHAREWISVSFCLWSINRLVTDRRLLQHYQFLIIPVLNPDGWVTRKIIMINLSLSMSWWIGMSIRGKSKGCGGRIGKSPDITILNAMELTSIESKWSFNYLSCLFKIFILASMSTTFADLDQTQIRVMKLIADLNLTLQPKHRLWLDICEVRDSRCSLTSRFTLTASYGLIIRWKARHLKNTWLLKSWRNVIVYCLVCRRSYRDWVPRLSGTRTERNTNGVVSTRFYVSV